jgi:hypothetical protein
MDYNILSGGIPPIGLLAFLLNHHMVIFLSLSILLLSMISVAPFNRYDQSSVLCLPPTYYSPLSA